MIFCRVNSSMPYDSRVPCATSGTQKWNGTIPSFMAVAVVMMIDAMVSYIFVIAHCP